MELQSLDDTGSNELIEVYVNESSSDPPKSTKQKIRKRDYSSLGGESHEQEVELSLDPDLEIDLNCESYQRKAIPHRLEIRRLVSALRVLSAKYPGHGSKN